MVEDTKTEKKAEVKKDDPLLEKVKSFWKGSKLEGLEKTLIDKCSKSSVPDICVKVIAVQTKYETKFGSVGTGAKYNNLTGIRDRQKNGKYKWRSYKSVEDSLVDTVKVFVEGKYEDYYTLRSFENGLYGHVTRWGTNHYKNILKDIYNNF